MKTFLSQVSFLRRWVTFKVKPNQNNSSDRKTVITIKPISPVIITSSHLRPRDKTNNTRIGIKYFLYIVYFLFTQHINYSIEKNLKIDC